jgi:hypothetical protein
VAYFIGSKGYIGLGHYTLFVLKREKQSLTFVAAGVPSLGINRRLLE